MKHQMLIAAVGNKTGPFVYSHHSYVSFSRLIGNKPDTQVVVMITKSLVKENRRMSHINNMDFSEITALEILADELRIRAWNISSVRPEHINIIFI